MPGLPPIQYSGFNFNNFNPTLSFIYDPNAGSNGAYRALKPADFNGPTSSSVSGQQGVRTGNGAIFPAQSRNLVYVQNLSTNVLYIALSGTASPSNYSLVLGGGNSSGDGSGGIFTSDSFYGTISVSGSSPSYLAWEM